MIAAELRGGSKPSLNEALGWIGSRVDDIYGASVGRLEDVWIDPGTGVPRWLLVKEGRFGGRTTLIPFEDATAGAGHVWVPYEREVVRDAPEIEPGAPLTQHVEGALRAHYSANAPSAISQGAEAATRPAGTELRPDRPAPQPEATPAARLGFGNRDDPLPHPARCGPTRVLRLGCRAGGSPGRCRAGGSAPGPSRRYSAFGLAGTAPRRSRPAAPGDPRARVRSRAAVRSGAGPAASRSPATAGRGACSSRLPAHPTAGIRAGAGTALRLPASGGSLRLPAPGAAV